MIADEAFWLRVLGRERIAYDAEAGRPLIDGEVVLITGAGGTIGHALVAACLQLGARRVIALDQSEYALYQLNGLVETGRVRTVLGSVLDVALLDRLMMAEPSVIFHAAAVKHVGFAEQRPSVAALVNIGGAFAVASCNVPMHAAVKRAVLISTDKAAAPTTIMGMTKRVAEAAWSIWGRRGIALRPVNVIGSSGSVGETFLGKIERGETVDVAQARRMFLTAGETAAFILESAAVAFDCVAYSTGIDPLEIADLAERIGVVLQMPAKLRARGLGATEKADEVLTDAQDGMARPLTQRRSGVIANLGDVRFAGEVRRVAETGNDRAVREILTRKFSNQEARVA